MNLLLIIATILVSYISFSVPHLFHVVKEKKTWTEAQQYCREKFTDLATIDNTTEMKKVKSLIQEAGAGHVWIGLRGKWQWSLADREFYGENEAEFKKWRSGQPNGYGGTGKYKLVNCVIQDGGKWSGQWNDISCSDTRPFICYDGKKSTHPYVLVNEKKNWADAQRYCREKHTDLASVRNQTENDQINTVSGNTQVWIGLFKAWEWSDGSSSSFRHWGSGEPSSKDAGCTQIQPGGEWNDTGCQHEMNFICYGGLKEVKQRQTVRVNIPVDSQVNINDPAVQQAILQQIQQRLREKGMPADAKLTWRKQPDGQIFHEEKKEKKEEGKKRRKRNEL